MTIIKVDLMSILDHKQPSIRLSRIHATTNNLTHEICAPTRASIIKKTEKKEAKSIKCIIDPYLNVYAILRQNGKSNECLKTSCEKEFIERE